MIRSFLAALCFGLFLTAADAQSFVAGGLDLATLESNYMGLEYVPQTGRVYVYPGEQERPKDYLLTVAGSPQAVVYDNPVLLLNYLYEIGWQVEDSWTTNRKDPSGTQRSDADPDARSRFYLLRKK